MSRGSGTTEAIVPRVESPIALGTARQQVARLKADLEVGKNLLQLLLLVGSPHIEGLVRVAHPDESPVTSQNDALLLFSYLHHLPASKM